MAKENEHIVRLQNIRAAQIEERRAIALEYEDSFDVDALIDRMIDKQLRIEALDTIIEYEGTKLRKTTAWKDKV